MPYTFIGTSLCMLWRNRRSLRLVPINKLIPALVFLWVFIAGVSTGALANDNPRVLVLHSYHQGFAWTDSIQKGFSDTLTTMHPSAEVFVEYMNTKRQTFEVMSPLLLELYKRSYSNVTFDVIVASDNNALDFLLRHRDSLFPGVPVVFCGINDIVNYRFVPGGGYTGVSEASDIVSTIAIGLKLHPGTKKAAIVYDATETGQINRDLAMKVVDQFPAVQFIDMGNLTAPQLSTKLAQLEDDTIVTNFGFYRDAAGATFSAHESMVFIQAASRRPVYTFWDFAMAPGAMGGKLISGQLQGKIAAGLVGRILRGEKADEIPVVANPTAYIFDYYGLQKFGVSESALPAGSIITGKPDTFYSRYKYYLWIGAVIFMLQATIIFQLRWNIVRRRQQEKALKESESLYRQLYDEVPVGYFEFDVEGRLTRVNQTELVMMGYSADEMLGHYVWEFAVDGEQSRIRTLGKFAGTDPLNNNDERYGLRKDGTALPALYQDEPCFDAAGRIIGIRTIMLPITERKQAEEALKLSEKRYRAIFETSQDVISITRLCDGFFVDVNQAFVDAQGYSRDELIGRNAPELNIWADPADRQRFVESLQRDGRCSNFEARFNRKDGELLWGLVSASVIDLDGTPCIVTVVRDITERKRAEEKINHMAYFDQLTELPNRTLLMDRLKQAMASSQRSGSHGALLFLDLDHFKTLNDTLGHDMGDLLLKQVAQRLTECVREEDTVARFGGDEFVVMLVNLSESQSEAASLVELIGGKINAALNHSYELKDVSYRITPSIGASVFLGQQSDIDTLLKQADLAMYKAKDAGRNTLRFFDPDMTRDVLKRVSLENDLCEAVLKKQFVLYYQVQMAGNLVTGAEALLRWQHPARGLVPPGEFISVIEETGLILPVGQWVLETACQQLADWAGQADMSHLTVAVNISAYQINHEDFVDQVLMALERSGAKPERLKLELTESLLVNNVEEIIGKMTALKAKGVGFSLDDFGTGYSSLSYLKRLPLDQLKIDQSFVRDILTDPNDAAIAKMIVVLADSLGLKVIAEGVETEAQREALAQQGCHAYQGYLFSRPVPIADFESYVRRV